MDELRKVEKLAEVTRWLADLHGKNTQGSRKYASSLENIACPTNGLVTLARPLLKGAGLSLLVKVPRTAQSAAQRHQLFTQGQAPPWSMEWWKMS